MLPQLTFAFFAALVILGIFSHYSRSDQVLQHWADENGYRILEKSYRHLFKGPFLFRTSKNQTVYHVVVQDKAANVGTCWVACGSFWLGLWSDQTKVEWEQMPQPESGTLHDHWLDD